MSCRETAVGSAFTSWARLTAGRELHEPAVLSTFHRLRTSYNETEPEMRRTYTTEQYHALLERQRARIAGASHLTERQRESLRRRIDRAFEEDVPDQSTLYALHNLVPSVRSRATARHDFITGLAVRTGESSGDLRERFDALSRGVTSRNAPHITREDRERAALLGLSRDPGTVAAMLQLESEARHIEAERARRAPQRITDANRTDVPEHQQQTPIPGVRVTSYGYDGRNGRLEVTVEDAADGSTVTHAYTNVPAGVALSNFERNPSLVWYDSIRGNPEYQYPDDDAAALDGAAPRCESCGQFADATHSCPPPRRVTTFSRWDRGSRWTRQGVPAAWVNREGRVIDSDEEVRLPAIRRLQAAVREGPVAIDISHSSTYPENGVMPDNDNFRAWTRQSGSVEVEWDDDGELQVDTAQLECSCATYQREGTCSHTDLISAAVRDRIIRPNREEQERRRSADREAAVHRAAERVQAAADRARANDWTLQEETAREAASTWRETSDVLYSENVSAFVADMDAALMRAQETGNVDIPYMTENALDGMATRESGQAFGMEIEFDLPPSIRGHDRSVAIQRIGQELYEAGITGEPSQQPYHASQRRGFTDQHTDSRGRGTWVFERDASVEGEIVSPGCYDEPETWQKLGTVMEILRRNGAVATTRTGMHVHVGTGGYNGSPAAYTELARITTQHEDALFRLGSDPQRGTHRNSHYARPMQEVPPEGFSDVGDARHWQMRSGGRTTILNLGSVSGGQSDHPEFRVFDGTLDPGAAQAQIKVAVGLVNAAERNAAAGGTARGQEAWGDHVRRHPDRDPNAATDAASMAEGSGTVRSLLDTLFRRREDKAQLASIFAHTRWTSPKF